MKKTISIIVSLLIGLADVLAQNTAYMETLGKILTGSVAMRSLDAGFTSDSLGHRRGLNPADPSFEIAYFFENRFEANLTVDLDMPSLYHQRNVLSKLNTSRSEAGYRQERQTILSEISDYYLELIYNIQLGSVLKSIMPKDSVELYRGNIRTAFDRGDIDALSYADLQMTVATLSNAIMETEKQIELLTSKIRMYNPDFTGADAQFPHFEFHGMGVDEFVEKAVSLNPLTDIMEKDSLIYERQLKLARWEWAPKIVVGARLDMDENRNFAPAAIAGFSIPLWENRGNIRHAKARMVQSSIENEKRVLEFRAGLKQLYERYTAAETMVSNWDGYDIGFHCRKLFTAYRCGLLTASAVYNELSHIMENAERIMQLKLERASCAARMTILLNGDDI